MNVTYLNSYFTIDQDKIVVNNEGLRFDTFSIKDSAGNAIVIDGIACHQQFYKFQIRPGRNSR
jgi:hypothetical protein